MKFYSNIFSFSLLILAAALVPLPSYSWGRGGGHGARHCLEGRFFDGRSRIELTSVAADPDPFSPSNKDGKKDVTVINMSFTVEKPNASPNFQYFVVPGILFKDASGYVAEVSTLSLFSFPAGSRPGDTMSLEIPVTFDGRDLDGAFLADGTYDYEVVAMLVAKRLTGKQWTTIEDFGAAMQDFFEAYARDGDWGHILRTLFGIFSHGEYRVWGITGAESTVAIDDTPPVINLVSPLEGEIFDIEEITVTGVVEDVSEISLLTVNGEEVFVTGGNFSTTLLLSPGENEIVVIAEDAAGNSASFTRAVYRLVEPPPADESTGYIHGVVYDDETGDPLPGAGVKALGLDYIVLTDEEGRFIYPVHMQMYTTLEFRLTISKQGYLDSGRTSLVPAGQHVAVDESYMVKIDEHTTRIGPAGGVAVSSDGLAEVYFPPLALPFERNIAVTVYHNPRSVHAPLPEGQVFVYAVGITPSGISLWVPATVRIYNHLGFSPGRVFSQLFFYYDVGEWTYEGEARVDPTGEWVEYQTDHFCSGGITDDTPGGGGPPPPPPPPPPPDGDGCEETGSSVKLNSGSYHESIVIGPDGKENGGIFSPWPIRLEYESDSVKPNYMLDYRMMRWNGPIQPNAMDFKIIFWGRWLEGLFEPQTKYFSRFRYLLTPADNAGNILPTGLYNATIVIANRYSDLLYEGTGTPTLEDVDYPLIWDDKIPVRNKIGSPFGAGWDIAGLKELKRYSGGGYYLVADGDDSMDIFNGLEAGDAVTVAGDGGVSIDLVETEARKFSIYQPTGIAFGPGGNLFVAIRDINSMKGGYVVDVNPGGQIVRIIHDVSSAGGYYQTLSENLAGLAVDSGGNLYIVDEHEPQITTYTTFRSIYKVSPDGQVSMFLGRGSSTPFVHLEDGQPAEGKGLWHPYAIFIDEDDSIYITDIEYSYPAVWKITNDGYAHLVAGGDWRGYVDGVDPRGRGIIQSPRAVCVDPAGNVLIVDDENHRIRKITPGDNPIIQTIAGNGNDESAPDGALANGSPLYKLKTVAIDPQGNVIFSEGGEFFINGSNQETIFGKRHTGARIRMINDRGRFQSITGTLTYDFTGEGTPSYRTNVGEARFLAYSPQGELYYSDFLHNRVRKIVNPGAEIPAMAFPEKQDRYTALEDTGAGYILTGKDGTEHTFDVNGRHVSSRDQHGFTITYGYSGNLLTSIIDSTGRTAVFEYNASGKLSRITDFSGQLYNFTVGPTGNLDHVTMPDGLTGAQFQYDSRHLLTGKVDPDGFFDSIWYNAKGMATAFSNPEVCCPHACEEIGPEFNIGLINDFLGPLEGGTKHELLEYDPIQGGGPFYIPITDNIYSWERAGLTATTRYFFYDEGQKIIAECLGPPSSSTSIWDNCYRTYVRDKNGNILGEADGSGSYTVRKYDDMGNLTYESPTGQYGYTTDSVSYDYDADCNALSRISLNWRYAGDMTKTFERDFEYDPVTCDLLIESQLFTDGTEKHTEHYYYTDTSGKKTLPWYTVFPDGNVEIYGYDADARGRLSTITRQDGLTSTTRSETTTYFYDSADRIEHIEGPSENNVLASYRYDDLGRLWRVYGPGQDPADSSAKYFQYSYESGCSGCCGCTANIHSIYDSSNGATTIYDYDPKGNLRSVTDPYGQVTQYVFNYDGSMKSVTDPFARMTTYGYDWAGRITSVTRPGGVTTAFSYDDPIISDTYDTADEDLLAGITDAEGRTYSYGWRRGNDFLESVDTPDAEPKRFSYTYGGWLETTSQTGSQGTYNRYYDDGKLYQKWYSYTGSYYEFSYDDAGRLSNVMEYPSWPPPTPTTAFTYDMGRMASETRTERDGTVTTVAYAYDSAGRLSTMTYPQSPDLPLPLVLHYLYEGEDPGKPTAILADLPDGRTGVAVVQDAAYDSGGRISGGLLGEGSRTWTVSRGLAGEVTAINIPGIIEWSYHYDTAGNITVIEDLLDTPENPMDRSFGYNALDGLEWAQVPGLTPSANQRREWHYDSTGNRNQEYILDLLTSTIVESSSWTYEAGTNKLSAVDYPDSWVIPDMTFQYDASGRMTRYGELTFEYDYAGMIKTALRGGIKVADYFYDWKNRRTRKIVYNDAGVVTDARRFAYDASDRMIYDRSSAQGTYQYIYLQDRPVAVVVGAEIYSLATDHLGTPWKAFDGDGNVAWEKYYDPWGNEAPGVTLPPSTIDVKLRFPGQYRDNETGLHYNWNRYYSPVIGRYISTDTAIDTLLRHYFSFSKTPDICGDISKCSTAVEVEVIHPESVITAPTNIWAYFSEYPYIYAANNPILIVDISGRGWVEEWAKCFLKCTHDLTKELCSDMCFDDCSNGRTLNKCMKDKEFKKCYKKCYRKCELVDVGYICIEVCPMEI